MCDFFRSSRADDVLLYKKYPNHRMKKIDKLQEVSTTPQMPSYSLGTAGIVEDIRNRTALHY